MCTGAVGPLEPFNVLYTINNAAQNIDLKATPKGVTTLQANNLVHYINTLVWFKAFSEKWYKEFSNSNFLPKTTV